MPVTDWTTQNPNPLFGAPPNCGVGCSANSWNVPAYDPDRDSIPSIQTGIIDKGPEVVVPIAWPYVTSDFIEAGDEGELRGFEPSFTLGWSAPVVDFSGITITFKDSDGVEHPELVNVQSETNYLFTIYVPSLDETFVLSGTLDFYDYPNDVSFDVTHVSGYEGVVFEPVPVEVTFTEAVVNDPPVLRTFFYTSSNLVSGPGSVELDSDPVSDDWNASADEFRSIKVHRVDGHQVDHASFLNAFIGGGYLRFTHPNGVVLFSIGEIHEFDPEYVIELEYVSGPLTPIGLDQELAIDFLPAGAIL